MDAAPEVREAGLDAAEIDASSVVDAGSGMDASTGMDATPGVDASADAAPEAGEAGTDASIADASVDSGKAYPDGGGTVAISTNTQIITVANGASLYIYDNHAIWSYGSAAGVTYQNLPAALMGTVGNDTVNTSTPVTFTLSKTTTCYLIRQDGWTSVDLTGWVPFATAAYYFSGYDNGGYGNATIYSQTFAAGVYSWNTYSAMYACATQY